MDLTSYLMGKKASGGGSGSNNVIIAHEDIETGILDIKPSDIIDANGNYLDKIVFFKFVSEGEITWIKQLGGFIDGDNVIIGFGEKTSPILFNSTISGDEYFTPSDSGGTH